MITSEQIAKIGSGYGDPSTKKEPQNAQLQALVNLTDAVKAIALVLVDIRDGKKDDGKRGPYL